MISTALITVTITTIITTIIITTTITTTIITTITTTSGVDYTPCSGRVSPPSTGTHLLRYCGGGRQQQEGSAQSRRQVARDRLFSSCFVHLLLQNCEEGFASLQAASEPAVRCRVVVIFSGGGRNKG
jgi:hypothetical protein